MSVLGENVTEKVVKKKLLYKTFLQFKLCDLLLEVINSANFSDINNISKKLKLCLTLNRRFVSFIWKPFYFLLIESRTFLYVQNISIFDK